MGHGVHEKIVETLNRLKVQKLLKRCVTLNLIRDHGLANAEQRTEQLVCVVRLLRVFRQEEQRVDKLREVVIR
jgi:hypothetical protein